MLVNNPRADGHMIICTQKHYHDLSECPDRINRKIIVFSSFFCRAIKKVYCCEKVYICSMCDGPMNHYHVQLIPRYNFEERGSKNFVKPRKEYVYDKNKITALKQLVEQFVHRSKEKNYK